jgi:hemolysin activation/secretion protein
MAASVCRTIWSTRINSHKTTTMEITTMHKPVMLFAFSALAFGNAFAEPPPPGAGSLLQQNQSGKPQAASRSDTGLLLKQDNGNALPPSAPFVVKSIAISGNTEFDTATLHALVNDVEGKSLTLEELGKVVDRITAYYHDHGYSLARAIIPAQTIEGGVVRVQVIEARYGKVKLDNRSRVSSSLLESTLSSLQSGQPIEQKALDHSLLLLSDIPGVATLSTLKPGDTVGTSDLTIGVDTPQTVSGSGTLDNFGNRYTGRVRLGATLNVFDLLHQGDVLSAEVLSTGSDMDYGRLSDELLLNGQGTRVGAAYSGLHYKLGDTLDALDGHGTADVASLWIKHPVIRSREANLYAQLQYDHKQLNDELGASGIHTDRHLNNWTVNLSGDCRDDLLVGGVNTWNLGWETGKLDFDNTAAQAADAATAKTQGDFQKWTLNLSRLQSINQNNALYVAFSGQWANTDLDASEKMVAGGAYTVRAYDMGVLSGDSGILGNVEWRNDLGTHWNGQMQAIAFIDSEHVTVNKNTWAAGENEATLSGAGFGLNWFGSNQWSIKATVAAPIGATPALIGNSRSVRGWLELSKAI